MAADGGWSGQVSLLTSVRDRRPSSRVWTWDDLVSRLTTFPVVPARWSCSSSTCSAEGAGAPWACPRCGGPVRLDKARLPAWSPASWRPGASRTASQVVGVSALVFDFDDGTPIEDARDRWRTVRHVGHTTYSHRPGHPRFRLVVPLAVPVPRSLWPQVWRWAAARTPGLDRSCSDPGRLYFLPARPNPVARWGTWVHDRAPVLRVDPSRLRMPPRRRRPVRCQHVGGDAGPLDDPRVRERLGIEAGGKVGGAGDTRVVRRVPCPACGRRSAWWLVEPARMSRWRCDHRQSCGASGRLSDLLAGQR